MQQNSTSDNGSPYHDAARLQSLQIMLCQKSDELFDALSINMFRTGKMYTGSCPVHGGDNINAVNFYPEGDTAPGYWKCNTRQCQRFFKRTVLGFIRGVLSHQKFDWYPSKKNPRVITFKESVDWACKFLNVKLEKINVDYAAIAQAKFRSQVTILTRVPNETKTEITRADVRERLIIPAKYYVERGYSKEVLHRYDIGLCNNPKKKDFYNRVVVPIYDNNYSSVIGVTGRSIHPKCEKCKLWHDATEDCPTEYLGNYRKWRNSESLDRDSILYNYWFAKHSIQESGIIILVEGPGEIWRLEEAGISMGCAMLGITLTDQQQILLETSGATHVISVTNNDAAGQEGDRALKEQLGRLFRLHFVKTEANDLGETSVQDVKNLLCPLIQKLRRK